MLRSCSLKYLNRFSLASARLLLPRMIGRDQMLAIIQQQQGFPTVQVIDERRRDRSA